MAPDVRWVGTESGYGRETEWSVVPVKLREGAAPRPDSPHPLDEAFVPGDLTAPDLGSREAIRGAPVLAWYPAETDVSIRPGWFYHTSQDARVKTPEKLVDIYFSSVGRNGVLLLNVPPDTRGRIADADVRSLQGMQAILDRTFSSPVAGARFPPPLVPRASTTRYEVPVAAGRRFDVALLQEDIRQGQRVEQFTLEICAAGSCRDFARGTTIGHKRLLRFPEVQVDAGHRNAQIRLTVTQSRATPIVSALSVYSMGPVQPLSTASGALR
jgi:alpha-L-fucosidase